MMALSILAFETLGLPCKRKGNSDLPFLIKNWYTHISIWRRFAFLLLIEDEISGKICEGWNIFFSLPSLVFLLLFKKLPPLENSVKLFSAFL